ncbi:MbcA/ParS/Xre antitoxin family protein [Maribacter sp. 1_MG-2023]|uniref:MbcA/ParS/Xre antitoxin family protein n=1 Tax=Maribacter sp. 1_MG-2023 TaxID=3062677 RepID=UPI0026E2DAE7|nr:MbcA/ParS/Xre antitoxin family protein [Maribacter sp. 1_MG-2023]MDO6470233.1 MbcA/ParS/Xre antitoxin family protein [Maribacter sp. 1_MG-2023]
MNKENEIRKLMSHGEKVFGDKSNFQIWLNLESKALGNITPKSLLETEEGIQLVNDELGRIEHGIFS